MEEKPVSKKWTKGSEEILWIDRKQLILWNNELY